MSKSIKLINEGFLKKYMKEDLQAVLEKEVRKVLNQYGYDTSVEGADNFISAAAEYIDMSRDYQEGNYSVEEWLHDTELNYPEELEFMKIKEESCLEEDTEIEEKEIFHNDNGEDYDIIERSVSGDNALLNRGKQWIVAWNCPKDNKGSWGQGHYFFDEKTAREVWEDKYKNESLEEDLDIGTFDDFKSDVYNALSKICFDYNYADLSQDDIEKALEWFEIHFFDQFDDEDYYEEGLCKKLKECIDKLNEAEISPEDKADSDMLRKIYKKIDGKQVTNKTFTPEEKELLKKYNLDAWGYRGDTKMVTDSGRKSVANADEFKSSWRKPAVADKINYADRARKVDSRDYAQNINRRKGWNQSFDDAEKDIQQAALSKNINNMKWALRDRRYFQSEVDNAENNLNKRLADIDKQYIDKIDDARRQQFNDVRYATKYRNDAQKSIDRILDKHRVKECLNKLNEAEISPEDKADSDLLRGIYRKILNRSNAALTPEEKAVVDKYNLQRTDRNFMDKDRKDFMFNKGDFESSWRSPERASKINYADKARKLGTREYAQKINNMSDWAHGKSFLNKERSLNNQEMGRDVEEIKGALSNRRYYNQKLDQAEKGYTDTLLKADKDRQEKRDRAIEYSKDRDKYNKERIDKANKDIKKILNKEESLMEATEKRIVKGLSGKKNKDILDSVLGQISDGIWENSPGMDGYWMTADINNDGDIVIDKQVDIRSGDRWIRNKYYDMTDSEVRRFFANKIKQICQEYLNDNNLNPYKEWNAESDEECSYLSRDEEVTIADAYAAYQALK